MIIDGRKIAGGIVEWLKSEPKPKKYLAAIQVGDNPATASFLRLKAKVAKELGVDYRPYEFPADVTGDELRQKFGEIASHKTCGGVMVELPMPESLNWYYVLNAIPPEKDVDVLSERSLGAFYVGRSKVLPPSVAAVEEILKNRYGDEIFEKVLATKTVAVAGIGLLIGRPVAHWIMRRAKETILLRSTSDLALLRQADIVIAGVGKAGLIKPTATKEGAVVIDFGYDDGKGDFDASDTQELVRRNISYTPTPGGTGPILVAELFENFYKLNKEK